MISNLVTIELWLKKNTNERHKEEKKILEEYNKNNKVNDNCALELQNDNK